MRESYYSAFVAPLDRKNSTAQGEARAQGGTETDLSQPLLVGLLPNNITRKSQTKDLFVPLFDLSINSKKAFNMLALVYLRHSNSFLLLLNGKLEQLRVSLI